MNEEYLRAATARQVDNSENLELVFRHGYGYQIWKTEQDGFAFSGLGGQLTVALPGRDFLMVCTGDNQGFTSSSDLTVNALFQLIVDEMEDTPIPEVQTETAALAEETACLALSHLENLCPKNIACKIHGQRYLCRENPMGITEFTFRFTDGGGELHYVNAQGEKVLPFGLGKNVFCKFPQLGYSRELAGVHDEHSDFKYDAAVSASNLYKYIHIIRKKQ